MEYLKNLNLTIETQRPVIVWLTGICGLLVGIILMFIFELRLGIESWLQLLIILGTVGLFVVLCNAIVRRVLEKKNSEYTIGTKFWFTVISVIFFLVIAAVSLAKLI